MGRNDISLKAYLSNKRRFADLFNCTLMGGSQVIDPNRLENSPTVMSVSDENGFMERINDISMRYRFGNSSLALITLENQEYIDYAMPLRVMLQQALAYDRQLKEIKSQNKNHTLQGSGEFLSKVKKADKILPVVILVAYWGEDEWDGAKSIHDMMDFEPQTEMLRQFVPEYKINFVNLKEYKDSENFKTELRMFSGLYFCKNSKFCKKRRRKMSKYIESHKECVNIDSDTFWAIANISDIGCLKGLEKYKEKEEIDMCKAFEENWLDGLEKGIEKGIEKGTFKTLCSLVKDGLIKSEEAAKRMNITEADFNEKMNTVVC
ncbi:MAG: Rpn family recombination-promoting nuclease/putative transposase [Lachnospiraceae bacterium]|nr:Rpn family recombination-promoting nuclease/putative transposase [Lachnospiraceae bacterium]